MTNSAMRDVLCLIPARGGSRRLPGKNIMPLNGKPLLLYTFEAALASGVFSRIMVSTEDQSVADIATAGGAKVHQRRLELANDSAQVIDVLRDLHQSELQKGSQYQAYCVLLPTCPLRSAEQIRKAHQSFMASEAQFLVSVCQNYRPVQQSLVVGEDQILEPLFGASNLTKRSQDLAATVHPNGAIYFYRSEAVEQGLDLFQAPTMAFAMDEISSIDIDTKLDFLVAEAALRMRAGD